jgi:hypothetical protein
MDPEQVSRPKRKYREVQLHDMIRHRGAGYIVVKIYPGVLKVLGPNGYEEFDRARFLAPTEYW